MFDWVRNLFSGSKPAARPTQPSSRALRARYDAAQSESENANRWGLADLYSVKSANSAQVRQILRRRSRYEVANNSYARGMVLTLANDLIGRGPRLKVRTDNESFNRQVESVFGDWCYATGFAEKLHVMALAKKQDGEGFALAVTNRRVEHPVKLDFINLEADQVTTPMPFIGAEDWVDGVTLDLLGNIVGYKILEQHPGDFYFASLNPLKYTEYDSKWVLHWFRQDRPGQVRGLPELMPAIPLFNQLRLFTQATLSAAETAALFAGVIQSDLPPDERSDADISAEAFDPIDIERGHLMTLPAGYKLGQLRAEHPGTTYQMFKTELLREIARCLNIPYNVASGDSSGYNYSSSKLDHILYGRSMQVEREQCERVIADKVYRMFVAEAVLVGGLLPREFDVKNLPPHSWFWDPVKSADPEKDANADTIRLESDTITYEQIYAEQGKDWADELEQRAREHAKIRDLREKYHLGHSGIDEEGRLGDPTDTPADGESNGDEGDDAAPVQARRRKRRLKASYFEDCERDDEGRCKPSGKSKDEPKNDSPAAQDDDESTGDESGDEEYTVEENASGDHLTDEASEHLDTAYEGVNDTTVGLKNDYESKIDEIDSAIDDDEGVFDEKEISRIQKDAEATLDEVVAEAKEHADTLVDETTNHLYDTFKPEDGSDESESFDAEFNDASDEYRVAVEQAHSDFADKCAVAKEALDDYIATRTTENDDDPKESEKNLKNAIHDVYVNSADEFREATAKASEKFFKRCHEASPNDPPPPKVGASKRLRLKASRIQAAITLDVPDLRQSEDWDCGAIAVKIVCDYFGLPGQSEADYIEYLDSTPENGTDAAKMAEYLEAVGLTVKASNDLDVLHLDEYVAAGSPVIVAIQDYEANEAEVVEDAAGHWVVVIGVKKENDTYTLTIQDPWAGRIEMEGEEFLSRWHDKTERDERVVHFGIAVSNPITASSYFEDCPRDDGGHCAPSGKAKDESKGEKPAAKDDEKSKDAPKNSNPALPHTSRPELSKDESAAVKEYTDGAYDDLNKSLRDGEEVPDDLKQVHEGLQAAFAKVETFEEPVTAYREMGLKKADEAGFMEMMNQAKSEGKPIQIKGYTSTSTSKKFGDNVVKTVKFEIEATKGLDVRHMSQHPEEDELLLDHDSQFEVVSAEKGGKSDEWKYLVKLRQIPK